MNEFNPENGMYENTTEQENTAFPPNDYSAPVRCANCGWMNTASNSYCESCGFALNTGVNNNFTADSNSVNMGYQPNPTFFGNGKMNYTPVTSLGKYLLYLLLFLSPLIIPVVGNIVVIVLACIGNDKNQKNFFKASAIIHAVLLVFVIIPLIIFIGITFAANMQYFDYFNYIF